MFRTWISHKLEDDLLGRGEYVPTVDWQICMLYGFNDVSNVHRTDVAVVRAVPNHVVCCYNNATMYVFIPLG